MADLSNIPLWYKLFCLYIEPVSTIVGFYYAWFQPQIYLELTDAKSAPGILGLPVATHVVLRQLGNLYLAFTLNEAIVLRVTNDVKVWRALLFGLLIADFGHLYSCYPMGLSYYYDVANWNSIAWGNIGFVYLGATTRTCFLLGIGFGVSKRIKTKARKSLKAANEEMGLITPSAKEMDQTPAQSTRRRKNKSRG